MDLLVVEVMRAPYGPIAKPDRTEETFLNYSHASFFADEQNEGRLEDVAPSELAPGSSGS